MKRRLEEVVKTESSGGYPSSPLSPPRHPSRTLTTVSSIVHSTYATTIKSTTDLRGVQTFPVQTAFANTMPTVAPAIKVHGGSMTPPATTVQNTSHQQQQQIQRLKVEDALSYLDLVKFKFGEKPQVYNDFLDIMKEFKSQSIDTPGVIERVSNLFNGHPELIVGFNTFLPPGYKIEVKSNDQGYSFQVQVSMPSTSPATTTLVPTTPPVHHSTVIPGAPLPSVVVSSPKPLLMSNTLVQHGTTISSVIPSTIVPAPQLPHPTPAATLPTYHNHTVQPTAQPIQPHHIVPQQTLVHVEAAAQQTTSQNQPVEFNHAINYVNKIKNRFQGQPDKYKRFLEILHTYQKEQRNLKEGTAVGSAQLNPGAKQLTEAEVYSQVAKLFEHQEDLLAEFGQFLPDATSHQANLVLTRKCEELASMQRKPPVGLKLSPYNNSGSNTASANSSPGPLAVSNNTAPKLGNLVTSAVRPETGQPSGVKRSPPFPLQPLHHLSINTTHHHHHHQSKKHKLSHSYRDVSLADAGKFGTLNEFAFFDKVRRALRNQEVYDNFLRCLVLFNQEIVSKVELIQVITPFLGRFPELFRWFKEFLGMTESPSVHLPSSSSSPVPGVAAVLCDNIINNVARQERPQGEQAMNIDFSSCKRLGASYCALPKNFMQNACTGRTALCKEVLNDTWVSFPTWSEESTFVTSRKTQYEEYIYRCEDERFELDVVLETNAATIRVLEGVHKKLCRMSSEEIAKFHLDDCLGGASPTIHQRALRRIYGDKATDIIDGLKKNPVVAVPVVLRRLKAKEDEWREAQKGFNKIWREQNEKYYLKSLDHQGINFKQNDVKALRSKSLFNEIETCYDERHEQADSNGDALSLGPHMLLSYRDKAVLDDAANLLIHHVKRQTSIHKEDKQRIKRLIRQFLPDLFHHPRQELSEDEREDADEKMSAQPSSKDNLVNDGRHKNLDDGQGSSDDRREDDYKIPIHAITSFPDEVYTLFFGNGNWYLFLRLHQILCDRLFRIYEQAGILAKEEAKYKTNRKESTSVVLRLKTKAEINVEDYYPAFLDMVKNVLDGNMDGNAYEDTLREMFGIHAYISFTLDKVVSYAVRQLQHLVADESCTECTDMYLRENRRGGAGGLCMTAYQRGGVEMSYQRKAESTLADENCFKIFIYKRDCKMTIELLDTDGEDPEPVREVEKWSAYVDRYAESHSKDNLEHIMDLDDEQESEHERRLWKKAVFLPRNIRLWHDKVGNDKSKLPKIDSCDEMQCRFNLNSYKMVFVVNRENYLYKRRALHRARQSHQTVSKKLGQKFLIWHRNWASENVSQSQRDIARGWLMGKAPDTIPNQTVCLTDNPLEKAPYRPYNRYKVQKIKVEK